MYGNIPEPSGGSYGGINTMLNAIDRNFEPARRASDRAYQQSMIEATREYERQRAESQRAYEEQTYEKRRAEGKADRSDERLRTLRDQAVAVGIDPKMAANMDELALSAAIPGATLKQKVADNSTLDALTLAEKAKSYGLDISNQTTQQLRDSVSKFEAENEAKNYFAKENAQIGAAMDPKVNPSWEPTMDNYARLVADKQKIMAEKILPEYHGIGETDKKAIGALMADDPAISRLLLKDKKSGTTILNLIRQGEIVQAANLIKDEDLANQITQAWNQKMQSEEGAIRNGKLTNGASLEYASQVQAYVKQLQEMPELIKAKDAEIQRMENDGYVGKALRRLDRGAVATRGFELEQAAKQKNPPPIPGSVSANSDLPGFYEAPESQSRLPIMGTAQTGDVGSGEVGWNDLITPAYSDPISKGVFNFLNNIRVPKTNPGSFPMGMAPYSAPVAPVVVAPVNVPDPRLIPQ